MTIAKISWLGPRPLRPKDYPRGTKPVLLGRERELRELVRVCESFDIVVITAPSGAGKTSFVSFARAELEKDELTVIEGQPWSDALLELHESGSSDPADLYRIAIGAPLARPSPVAAALRELTAGDDAVVLLDQFEELLRYNRPLGRVLLELIEETASATHVTHIVVIRSEFRDQLRPLEEGKSSFWHIALREIDDKPTLARIIAEPCRAARVAIEPGAVQAFLEWWEEARHVPRPGGGSSTLGAMLVDVGLLQLQALLWSFREWAKEEGLGGAKVIRAADVEAFRDQRAERSGGGRVGGQLIRGAVDRYVGDVIDAAAFDPAIRWKNGPRLMLARIAPFLTSAGYKIPQAFTSLLPLALQEELEPEQRQELREHAGSVSTQREVLLQMAIGGSGIAHDWPPDEIGLEMLTCLEAGLKALKDANVLRVFRPADDTIYELVHDGLGAALERWAGRQLQNPMSFIGLIADRNGQAMRRDLAPSIIYGEDGDVDPRWGLVSIDSRGHAVIERLHWTGNKIIGCSISDVVFRNCWFVGSVFDDVALRNVTFDHCTMRGVAMIRCHFDNVDFVGDISDGDEGTLDTLAIVWASAGADVTFADLKSTTGLFLTQLAGGKWTFRNSNLEHVRLHSDGRPIVLGLEESILRHFTLDTGQAGAARVEVSGNYEVVHRTDEYEDLDRAVRLDDDPLA